MQAFPSADATSINIVDGGVEIRQTIPGHRDQVIVVPMALAPLFVDALNRTLVAASLRHSQKAGR